MLMMLAGGAALGGTGPRLMLMMLAGGLRLVRQAPADAHDARCRPALGETGPG